MLMVFVYFCTGRGELIRQGTLELHFTTDLRLLASSPGQNTRLNKFAFKCQYMRLILHLRTLKATLVGYQPSGCSPGSSTAAEASSSVVPKPSSNLIALPDRTAEALFTSSPSVTRETNKQNYIKQSNKRCLENGLYTAFSVTEKQKDN